MFKINRKTIEDTAKTANAKIDKGNSDTDVFDTFKLAVCNIIEIQSALSKYDMCHWINYIDRWICNNARNNSISYGRGAIVNVDLGAQNYKHEPSYLHPCIILCESKYSALVVPCSSKQYSKGYIGVIDAEVSDGFSVKTGVQMQAYRWVHKNRIISPVGHVNGSLLDKIDREMLSIIPSYKLEIAKLNADIVQKQADIDKLQNDIENLNKKLAEIQDTNN